MAYPVIGNMLQLVVRQSLQRPIDTLNNYQHSSAMKLHRRWHCTALAI